MSSLPTQRTLLLGHPLTPTDAVCSLGVQVRAEKPDILVLEYSLDADMSRILVPPRGFGCRTDGLWKHTCFEVFVAPADSPGYHEFNFSPSLDWAIYRFNAYRNGMTAAESAESPQICVRRGDYGLELQSAVCLGSLGELRDARRLRLAVAAVIEDNNGRLSYWGLRHPPGKPDFHHPNAFALELNRS